LPNTLCLPLSKGGISFGISFVYVLSGSYQV
jgi:hypothetical protein